MHRYVESEGQHTLLLLHATVGSMMGAVDAVVYAVTSSGMRHFFTSLQFRLEQSRVMSSRLKGAGHGGNHGHGHRGGVVQRRSAATTVMRRIGELGSSHGRRPKGAGIGVGTTGIGGSRAVTLADLEGDDSGGGDSDSGSSLGRNTALDGGQSSARSIHSTSCLLYTSPSPRDRG